MVEFQVVRDHHFHFSLINFHGIICQFSAWFSFVLKSFSEFSHIFFFFFLMSWIFLFFKWKNERKMSLFKFSIFYFPFPLWFLILWQNEFWKMRKWKEKFKCSLICWSFFKWILIWVIWVGWGVEMPNTIHHINLCRIFWIELFFLEFSCFS